MDNNHIPQGQPSACMMPGCPSPDSMDRATHGLCRKCYKSTAKQVKAGMVTWDDLVEQGIAIPAIERSRAYGNNVAQVLRDLGIVPKEDSATESEPEVTQEV